MRRPIFAGGLKGGDLTKKKPNYGMSSQDYREFLKHVELKSINLDSCNVKTKRENIGPSMMLDIRHDARFSIEEEKSGLILSTYKLTATKKAKKDYALKVDCVYRVLLMSEEPLTEDFLQIFLDVNVQMNTWPFYRELVQNMVYRVGFPQLTLPLLKR